MDFFIVNTDGTEQGPFSRDQLQDMAKQGCIHADTPVRNNMMRNPKPASGYPFLRDALPKGEYKQAHTKVQPMKALHLTNDAVRLASTGYRAGAATIDWTLILAVGYAMAFVLHGLGCTAGTVVTEVTAGTFSLALLYFTFTIGMMGQTLGQRFFGIIVVHGEEGQPCLADRAFMHSLLLIMLLPLNGLVAYIAKRGIHELVVSTRVVNLRMG